MREIERRVTMAGARDLKGVNVPDAPVGELEDFDKQVRLMFDLIALAYQADLTRVASYVMVAEGTNRTYNQRRCAGFASIRSATTPTIASAFADSPSSSAITWSGSRTS